MTDAAPSRGFNPESPKEAGQFTLRVVSFVIFLSGQLFNLNCCADLPTSATALLYELHTLRPTLRPTMASIQNPP